MSSTGNQNQAVAEVESWFTSLNAEQRPIADRLRQLILAADVRFVEEIKWSRPCYKLNRHVCYLHKSKSHVTIGFQQGAKLVDAAQILSGDGKEMRHCKYASADEIDQQALHSILQEAIALDQAG